jgi:hypothetical protein
MNQQMDGEEFEEISKDLEKYHEIFYKLWNVGRPQFTDKIKTAAVYFDKVGKCIDFNINPEYWDSISTKKKSFIICHELLHVILYHGVRISKLDFNDSINICLDIPVNEMLVSSFGFMRNEIDSENVFCWSDKFDKDFKTTVAPSNMYFEYYFSFFNQKNKTEQNKGESGDGAGKKEGPGESENNESLDKSSSVDDHSLLDSFINKEFEDFINEEISKQDKESLSDIIKKHTTLSNSELINRGCSPGNTWLNLKHIISKKKGKWETVIKKWVRLKITENETEQWQILNRRMAMLPNDFFLPSYREIEDFDKEKMDLWFFQDTSGSCASFAPRFFKAARSIPTEKFNISVFCFDTRVYPVSLKDGILKGFGGTSFDILERYIQNEIIKGDLKKYPDAIFVITDGYGNYINPQFPKRWHWFLSNDWTRCIHQDCNIYKLTDYE